MSDRPHRSHVVALVTTLVTVTGILGAASLRPDRLVQWTEPATSVGLVRAPVVDDYLALIPTLPARPASPAAVVLPPGFYTNVPTTDPVVFLTIDDGYEQSELNRDLIARSGLPMTAFLMVDAVHEETEVEYFRGLQAQGLRIENKTISNPNLTTMDYNAQLAEVCGAADQLGAWFGRPRFLRPPQLQVNDDTLRVAQSCGHSHLFGGVLAYSGGQRPSTWWHGGPNALHPGDIVMLHFDEGFADSLVDALQFVAEAGLTVALLEDYVIAPSTDSEE